MKLQCTVTYHPFSPGDHATTKRWRGQGQTWWKRQLFVLLGKSVAGNWPLYLTSQIFFVKFSPVHVNRKARTNWCYANTMDPEIWIWVPYKMRLWRFVSRGIWLWPPYFCTNQLCGCFINRRWLQSLHQIQVSMAFMIYLKFATSALKDAAELRLILKMFLSLKSSRF